MTLPSFGPPTGVGCYGRAQSVEWFLRYPWAFIALNAERRDAEEKARQLIARGKVVYFWSGPGQWNPVTYPGSVASMLALVRRTGARGFIVDAENDWGGIRGDTGRDVGRAFGRLLKDAARSCSVGFTSHPAWNHTVLAGIAETARGSVWATLQVYFIAAQNMPHFLPAIDRWKNLFGEGAFIPSVAAWQSHPVLGNEDGYQAYLHAFPPAPGAIAFTAGTGPDFMMRAVTAWNPSGGGLGGLLQTAQGILSSTAGKIVCAIVAVILAAVAWAVMGRV